jgi:hypothetical protein
MGTEGENGNVLGVISFITACETRPGQLEYCKSISV